VKNPGPYCKRCYHKHVWTGGKGSGRQEADDLSERMEDGPVGDSDEGEELEMMNWDPGVHDLLDRLPESTDDDQMIPF
jgi:hypothetical protein